MTKKTDNGKHLSSIVSSEGKIEFTSVSGRSDLTVNLDKYRINEIKLFGKDNYLLKYFQLGQSFVQSSGSTPSTATESTFRMYLDDLKEYASDATLLNTQTFEYYSRTSFPPRLSYKQDHWGYYNNKSNVQMTPAPLSQTELLHIQSKFPSFVPANRDPDGTVSYYGSLKKVTYPTGGTVEYAFEGNDVAVCQTINVPTNLTAAASLTFSGSEQTQTVNFYVDNDQWVNINYNVLMNGFRCFGAYAQVRTTDSGNPFVQQKWGGCAQMTSPVQLTGNFNAYMKAGNYELQVKVFQGPESGYPPPFGTQPESASVTVKHVGNVPTFYANAPTGGIRLKQLTASDGSSTSPDIVKAYKYTKANNGGCANASSGVYLGRTPRYESSDYSIFTFSGCMYRICQYSNLTSSSLLNLVNAAGATVAYQEVWAWDGQNAENGKKYFSYDVFQDGNPNNGPNFYDVFINTPTVDYSWKNGRAKEEKTISATGQVVGQTLYEYEFNETIDKHVFTGIIARKAIDPCMSNNVFSFECDGTNEAGEEFNMACSGPFGYNCYTYYFPCYNVPAGTILTNSSQLEPYAIEWYNIISQSVYLKKTTNRVLNSDGSGNYVETNTTYTYDTPLFRHHFPTKTMVVNSDSWEYSTITKYPPEYNTTTVTDLASVALKNLVDNYVIGTPVEVLKMLKKNGIDYVTGGQLIKYKNFGGNATFPNLMYQLALTTPISSGFVNSSISAGNFISDSRYYLTKEIGNFNSSGKVLEWRKADDPAKRQYIWGHNSTMPIAEVVNAESNEVAFTSFEDPPSCLSPMGGWTFSGACGGFGSSAGNYYSGRTGFNLSQARWISKTVPNGSYVVSCWHRDGSIYINGALVSTSTGGQWKFAEKVVTGTSIEVRTLSASGDWSQFIDELRLYPADALMRTFSFDDRSKNLLTISDENSVPAQFEYDNAQRLQLMRDQDGNITQTYEYNYRPGGGAINNIKARTVLMAGNTTIAQVNALSGKDVRRVFQFIDGLGRPIQTNEVGQSPSAYDIITYQVYDAFGRSQKQYLPYTIASNGGAYRTGFATEQSTFANNYGAGGYGYAETCFELSPANRVLEQSAPGASWRIGLGHTLEYKYFGNAGNTIKDFKTASAYYAANSLLATEELDENERKKTTYTDKLGNTILVAQELNATETALTYTIYDDFGRIAAVLPPETTKKLSSPNSWSWGSGIYASMIFKYTYDDRGRAISKTVPSGGTTTTAYDKLDRPVLSTDANGFKVFTRYDILSRPVVTGKYKGAAVPGTSNPLYETPNTTAPHYYTSTSFPTDNNLDVYKVFYYDDYDLNNDGNVPANESYTNPAESPYETVAFLRTRGKPTATRTGILNNNGSAPGTFLTTRTYYDKEYSVIQVNKQNHLGGADISSTAYDFANRATHTRRDHTATPPGGTLKTYTVKEEYTFDDAGRTRFTRHKINGNNWTVTAAPLYDEMGRLQDKRLHASNYDGVSAVTLSSSFTYLQSLDYAYNIRGWLTAINNPASCALAGNDNLVDLFSMSLDYESTANGASPQYNGNIASIQWRTNINGTCLTQQQYRFSYDYANRLTVANHYTHNGTAWVNTNNYSESGIIYDQNGNIKNYTRRGLLSPGSYGNIDQLTYTYGDALRPDRLTQMADAGSATKGFVYTAAAAAYQYDLNGNMTVDNHKGFTLAYNCLNLPQSFTQGANAITMTYTADGEKLTKALTGGGATKNYISGIEYSGANLEAIYFSEGRCTPASGTAFFYEYTIKDHLGNARVSFRAITNGTAIQPLQENHYYPFGMEMEGTWLAQVGTENQYEYNGKELNEDFGLGLYDYGARWYDASVGRWGQIDPMAEDISQISISPYHYTFNNPISFFDPDGMQGTNEYVRDYVTGETVQVGDKGGDEVDYIYNGTIKKDGEGNVEGVNYTEYGAVVMNVEKMHSFDAGGGGFTEVIREPGLLATVYHAPASGGIESTEDPITIFAGGVVRAGVTKLSTAMGTTVTRGTAVALEGQVAKTVGSKLPTQIHHFATNKHSVWTSKMECIAKQFGLDLNGAWNKAAIPHLGRHPNAYHQFVYEGMQKAAAGAGGNQAKFLQLFDQYVKQPVLQNPNLLRKSGW